MAHKTKSDWSLYMTVRQPPPVTQIIFLLHSDHDRLDHVCCCHVIGWFDICVNYQLNTVYLKNNLYSHWPLYCVLAGFENGTLYSKDRAAHALGRECTSSYMDLVWVCFMQITAVGMCFLIYNNSDSWTSNEGKKKYVRVHLSWI